MKRYRAVRQTIYLRMAILSALPVKVPGIWLLSRTWSGEIDNLPIHDALR